MVVAQRTEKAGRVHWEESWRIDTLRALCAAGAWSPRSGCQAIANPAHICHDHRRATGGSIPSLLPRLSDAELSVTESVNNTGNVRIAFSFYSENVHFS